jgi:hypothetical protein
LCTVTDGDLAVKERVDKELIPKVVTDGELVIIPYINYAHYTDK